MVTRNGESAQVDKEVPDTGKTRLRRANNKISRDPRTDPKKLLEYIFETLCSLRATAKTFDHLFLAYLIEMAALEAESQLKSIKDHEKSAVKSDS